MTNERNGGGEPVREGEWAWVADVYDEIPQPSAAEIERVAALTADEVSAAGRRRGRVARRVWWGVGVAAALALIVVGWQRRILGTRPAAPAVVPESSAVASMPAPPVPPADTAVPIAPRSAPPRLSQGKTDRSPASPRADVAVLPPAPAEPHVDSAAPAPTRPSGAAAPSPAPSDPPSVAPSAARIPGANDEVLARLRAGLGEDGLQALAALFRDAAAADLPAAPLLDRAQAGVAHGASSSVILATVGRRVQALRQARGALGGEASAAELTAGADALEGGAGTAELLEIRQRFPRTRTMAGLLALAGLVTGGVPAPAAAKALVQGVDAGASDATLLSWRAGVLADVAHGVAPLAALQAQVKNLGDGAMPNPDGDARDRDAPIAPAPQHSVPADLPGRP